MSSSQPIETETIQVTPTVKRYLEALQEYGLMEEGDGGLQMNATGESMLRALHHFLAGGEVSVSVTTEGSSSTVDDLNGILDRLKMQCMEIPRSSGIVCY